MKPSETFTQAAELIEPAGRWHQGSAATDDTGMDVVSADSSAVCWCLAGAIWRIGGLASSVDLYPFLYQAIGLSVPDTTEPMPIFDWNDTPGRTQAEVVSVLRKSAQIAAEAGR